MLKFYEIPTYDYEPISHEKSYLFKDYEKISNFLAIYFNRKTRDILAKPIQNTSAVDWYSNYTSLKPIDELPLDQKEKALNLYWIFIENVKLKIAELRNGKEEDKHNWATILEKVFDEKNNVIFFNGEEISLVWGWKFFNNNNYKPRQLELLNKFDENLSSVLSIPNDIEILSSNENIEEEAHAFENAQEITDSPTVFANNISSPTNFFAFIKWFASSYWWLLLILLLLILLLLLIKLFVDYYNYLFINNSISRILIYLNRCCGN